MPTSNATGAHGLRLTALAAAGTLAMCCAAVGYAHGGHSQSEPGISVESAHGDRPYSPPLRDMFPDNVYFGDLHLHTHLSTDAYLEGTVKVSQADAYRFAMGQPVRADSGMPARLRRPLDFVAVTDHAENLGLYVALDRGLAGLRGTALERQWNEVLRLSSQVGLRQAFGTVIRQNGSMPRLPSEIERTLWTEVAETADQFYRPGEFTTLIGYEWTGMITGDNLHRVVLYRDGAREATRSLPFTALESNDPEALWAALERYSQTGGQILAIAHNGNLSNGRMFSPQRANGQPIDADYASTRARWEPVYEVTQVKGDGETHPSQSPRDEFADFERWDDSNVANTAAKEPWMLRYEYARTALADGLRYHAEFGTNPIAFGMIGSSDIHTGLSSTSEDNFMGKYPDSSPPPDRMSVHMAGQSHQNWELGASGIAAIWAEENTREALFDALMRREVYATTGTRIRLRFFGGWDFAPEDLHRDDYVRHAYLTGVPMGGTLPYGGDDAPPRFLVHAMRDPDAANLDRIQVVKGWVDEAGQPQERIYDVALSDGREVRPDGSVEPVGNTVDEGNARYRNSIGSAELSAWWTDPDFDPEQAAVYYVRVLEIPTPRWTSYDAAFFHLVLSSDIPFTLQERAYSSPIWYYPDG